MQYLNIYDLSCPDVFLPNKRSLPNTAILSNTLTFLLTFFVKRLVVLPYVFMFYSILEHFWLMLNAQHPFILPDS